MRRLIRKLLLFLFERVSSRIPNQRFGRLLKETPSFLFKGVSSRPQISDALCGSSTTQIIDLECHL